MESISNLFMLRKIIDNSITLCCKRVADCPESSKASQELEKQFKNDKSISPLTFKRDIKLELEGFQFDESGDPTYKLHQQLSFGCFYNSIEKIGSQKTIGQELASLNNNISFFKRIIHRLKDSIEMFEKKFQISKKFIKNLESFNKNTSNLIQSNQQYKRDRSPEEFVKCRKKSKKLLSCPQILNYESEISFLNSMNVNAIMFGNSEVDISIASNGAIYIP
ncbi:hypothetical protein BpHYR1_026684 [Brachionus plicatilis]|uniref:Uncharacterized protein n=1 Tax=Brachionus plicatilis TaxID=10195 RepID=A0A3M7RU07_BRAPC|nr:hypothetical protein BpHYR1_026684 [Brachionus plicatilis]